MSVVCGNSFTLPTVQIGSNHIVDLLTWGLATGGTVIPLLTDDILCANMGPTVNHSLDAAFKTHDLATADGLQSAIGTLIGRAPTQMIVTVPRGTTNNATPGANVIFTSSLVTCIARSDSGAYGVATTDLHYKMFGYAGARPTYSIALSS